MADIRVPTLGESVTEATVGKWFKQPGDAVAVDEPLVELETDKVTLEVPAPGGGVCAAIAGKGGAPGGGRRAAGNDKGGAGGGPAKSGGGPGTQAGRSAEPGFSPRPGSERQGRGHAGPAVGAQDGRGK